MPKEKAARPRLSPAEKAAQLRAQADRLDAIAREAERKRDARQKIVLGGAVIAEARENEAFAQSLTVLLNKRVTRQIDREAITEWLSTT